MSDSALPPNDKEMSLVQHLLDLKSSLTRGITAIILFFLVLFPFANEIYTYIAEPLTRYLPEGTSMIATAVASPFLTPFKLSFVLAIYLAMPYLLYQLWRFIAPALYSHEKQLVGPILFFSSFLFYAGGAFAYYVVFPLVFGFLSQTAPEGVTVATDISLYLDFVIKMFFAFGMAFEVPIVTVLLILTGITKPEKLSHARPYIVVGAFVIGMLLTPPDIISQTLLAVPMWLLFELGLVVGTYVSKRRKQDDEDTEENTRASSTQNSQTDDQPEYEFDDRYADQVDDDLDWDDEFERIDSEMQKLEREYQAQQEAEKKAAKEANKTAADKSPNDDSPESDKDKPTDKA
ncbi:MULTISPECIES: twin-arginine translocase subunit TatC [Thiomicrorhabdus]|uniref:Sec-independent protein translocase protein TatC n=1 Tax=Thiomicrorhabdus heinhorstiae TaxID=2748010 RepID=A0ABS0BUD4_9GAMM|nr:MULTISPECIES: twin-arginine translocase subunit TatC [Thiomicrorhabdus]MBF6057448.1 twin-arginine translocase subunit TatC [Thiomicrorhabdus heinhorstiae]